LRVRGRDVPERDAGAPGTGFVVATLPIDATADVQLKI